MSLHSGLGDVKARRYLGVGEPARQLAKDVALAVGQWLALHQLDRLPSVAGLTRDLHVRLRADDHPEAGPDKLLVVGDRDSDHAIGSFERTVKPPTAVEPASRSPPNSATLSRIPINPWPVDAFTASSDSPRPLSRIVISSASGRYDRRTSSREAFACLSLFVIASCTILYAVRSNAPGHQ